MKALFMAISGAVASALVAFLMGNDDRVTRSMEPWQFAFFSDCRQCHGGSRGAAGFPSTRILSPHDAAIESARPSTGGAPRIVIIGQLAELYSPVVFDHRMHAEMSAITGGCGNCHHNALMEGEIALCRKCHSIERNGGTIVQPSLKGAYHRQCLGCHRDWSHENGCGYCHREQTTRTGVNQVADLSDTLLTSHPRIERSRAYVYDTAQESSPLVTFNHLDHAKYFGLRCVDCHKGGSCASCHDGNLLSREPVTQMSPCRTCHSMNPCNFCHDTQPREEFDHARRTGWDLDPHHAEVPCIACHGRVGTFVSPSKNCRSCHGGLNAKNFDHNITGVPLLGSHAQFDCVRCHVGSRADTPATCNGCHPRRSYPAELPGQCPTDRLQQGSGPLPDGR